MAIFKLGIVVTADDKASKKLAKFPKQFQNIAKAVGLAAAGYVALKGAQKAVDFVKLGANIEATENRFFKLVGSGDQANKMLQALDDASMGTITRFGALETASQLFGLGLATNAEDMGIAGAMISRLGRAGLSTEGRMNSLTMLLANQSTRRLDDFGLSVEKVRERQEALEEQGLSTEQAFKTAVFDEASQKLDTLGDTSDLAATKIARTEASLTDTKNALAEMATAVADATGVLDATATWADSTAAAANAIRENSFSVDAWVDAMKVFVATGGDSTAAMKVFTEQTQKANDANNEIGGSLDTTNALFDAYAKAADIAEASVGGVEATLKDTDQATKDLIDDLDKVTGATDDYTIASSFLEDQLEEQRKATLATAMAARESAADFSSFGREVAKSAEDFAKEKEDIEDEHQKNLAKIAKKGWSTAIKFDAAAETERLSRLKERLQVSLQQQAEFTDKTKASQRESKEFSIANLQEDIAAKEAKLADFYAGRLVKAGMNTTALVAAEQARFDEEIAIHDASRKEQERIQRESLGRMIIETITAAGRQAGATEEAIEAMRFKISEEYGIITADGVAAATAQKDTWLENFALIEQKSIEAFNEIANRINLIPKTITVDIVFQQRQAGKEAAEAQFGSAVPGMAAGGISPGGPTLVGELGTEMVDMAPGARVTPASQTNDNRQYKFEQIVNTRASTHSIMDDFAQAEAQVV